MGNGGSGQWLVAKQKGEGGGERRAMLALLVLRLGCGEQARWRVAFLGLEEGEGDGGGHGHGDLAVEHGKKGGSWYRYG